MGFFEIDDRNIPLCPLHRERTIRLTIGGWLEISCDCCGGKSRYLFDWCVHVHNLYIKLEARSVNPVHAPPPEPVSRPSGASGGAEVASQPVEPPREPEKADSRPPGGGLDPLAEIVVLQQRLIETNTWVSELYGHISDLLRQVQQLDQRLAFFEGVYSGLKSQSEYHQKMLNHLRETMGSMPAKVSCLEGVVADLVSFKLTK